MKTGFLLAEDEAVKLRFSGATVSDDRKSSRPVQVFFRYPEGETEKKYPFITIELIDVLHATDRQYSDTTLYIDSTYDGMFANHPAYVDYWPSESASVSASVYFLGGVDPFIPVDLLYQVSIYSRSALHDRQLTARLLSRVVPFRYNSITIPADGTVRRFDMLDWTNADLLDMEAGYRKRVFRKVLTIKMSAEITSQTLDNLIGLKPVESVSSTIISQTHVFNP